MTEVSNFASEIKTQPDMKKIITIIIALTAIITFDVYPAPETPTTVALKELEDYSELPDKGNRTSHTYWTCVIDFSNFAIATERIPMIISYELWDETGENIVAVYPDDYDMVVYMSSLSGCYQLRLVTAESTYIGYIEL